MPRPGGESDKLGNRYESLWSVHNVLRVDGQAVSVEVEAFEESKGIEFIKTNRDGSREFHSVKRQHPGPGWTLSELTRRDEHGRSVLGDLFEKLAADNSRKVIFASMTVHAETFGLWDRTQRCQTPDNSPSNSKPANPSMRASRCLVPMFSGDESTAFNRLRRLSLVQVDE